MANLQDAIANWTSYATELKNQRDAAVAALDDANSRAQAAADALQQFQDDDAATDAQQLADQAQQDADAVQAALDELQGQLEPTPPDEPAPDQPDQPAPDQPDQPAPEDGPPVAE